MSSNLFKPMRVGAVELSHRLVMAPLTRLRASKDGVPLPFVKDYYEQRACVPGTLLISEATIISPAAGGHPNAPGIYLREQVEAWKEVTAAVHAKKSYIYIQLWALGRAAEKSALDEMGERYVAPSPVPLPHHKTGEPGPVPEALTEQDIKQYVEWYRQAAKNAMDAGFDGVEIHSANGYLLDEFIQDISNKRTDRYGGSDENRARFTLEATSAVASVIGPERVGVRLSPWNKGKGMGMAEPRPVFNTVIRGLKAMGIGYLHVVLARIMGIQDTTAPPSHSIDFALDTWRADGYNRPFLAAGGYKPESAIEAVDNEYKDADVGIVFGRYYISNPDLAFRIREGLPMTPYERKLFYNKGEQRGYTDYPFSAEFKKAARLA